MEHLLSSKITDLDLDRTTQVLNEKQKTLNESKIELDCLREKAYPKEFEGDISELSSIRKDFTSFVDRHKQIKREEVEANHNLEKVKTNISKMESAERQLKHLNENFTLNNLYLNIEPTNENLYECLIEKETNNISIKLTLEELIKTCKEIQRVFIDRTFLKKEELKSFLELLDIEENKILYITKLSRFIYQDLGSYKSIEQYAEDLNYSKENKKEEFNHTLQMKYIIDSYLLKINNEN